MLASRPRRPPPTIYQTDAYRIETDRVSQGPIEVIAESADRLVRHRPEATEVWEASHDVSRFPTYTSDQPLVDALHRLSLDELVLDIRDDGAFRAGKKWDGVWTRDVSYAALLSFALLDPEATERSLRARVDDGRIVQDTGTGGSWPVSTDRVTWALAAWELYKVTGDDAWLVEAYAVVERSVRADLETAYDDEYGLFRGESSFLDWREQTYPAWMEPRDIAASLTLGTNAVYVRTFQILAEMADRLDKPHDRWRDLADRTADAIDDHLWQPNRGYYAQYLYGRHHRHRSPRSETLGAALAMLFGIAGEQRADTLVESLPTLVWGPPCIHPQIPDIPPYHNDGIWPFVVGYWTWAAAQTGHAPAVEHGLGSLYRAAAMCLTNKENMVASTGAPEGTELNSDRQLWSVAGTLATVYRVFFGLELKPDGIELNPCVPKAWEGRRRIEGLAYRGATWTIELRGYGTEITSVTRDGEPVDTARLPAELEGEHTLRIELTDEETPDARMALVDHAVSPRTPEVSLTRDALTWEPIPGADAYAVLENGDDIATVSETSWETTDPPDYTEYQVVAIADDGTRSFASEPVVRAHHRLHASVDGDWNGDSAQLDDTVGDRLALEVDVPTSGTYLAEVHYANGHGPVHTGDKCAVRTLHVDGEAAGPVVMPQRGDGAWDDFGYSNAVDVDLAAGRHTLALVYGPDDRNMNGAVNSARVDHLRLTRIGGTASRPS